MKQEFFTESFANVVAKVLFATAAMLAFVIWNTPGVAQGGSPLPPCGPEVQGCYPYYQTKCQQKGQFEPSCSGLPFNYLANYTVVRWITPTCYENGYAYECQAYFRIDDCCTIVHNPLPPCPEDTCEKSGIGE